MTSLTFNLFIHGEGGRWRFGVRWMDSLVTSAFLFIKALGAHTSQGRICVMKYILQTSIKFTWFISWIFWSSSLFVYSSSLFVYSSSFSSISCASSFSYVYCEYGVSSWFFSFCFQPSGPPGIAHGPPRAPPDAG